MDLGKDHSFLVINFDESQYRVKIVALFSDVAKGWRSSTRISPIWGVEEFGTSAPSDVSLDGQNWLLLLGPVHPERITTLCVADTRVWLTLGLLNLMICTKDLECKNRIASWAETEQLAIEVWTVEDGLILDSKTTTIPSGDWHSEIETILNIPIHTELEELVRECCSVMSTSMSRSAFAQKEAMLDDLKRINGHVHWRLDQLKSDEQERDSPYKTFGHLLDINMGLGRFASQTFSGTPNIANTECHIRTHSLLGIGTASIALWRLRGYIQKKLGDARIPEKFDVFHTHASFPNLSALPIADDYWTRDHLKEIELNPETLDPLIPLVSYFSARDGFRSTATTISVPLATIGACNSIQWSLLTITHEISHIIVHNVLSKIYPRPSIGSELTRARKLVEREIAPGNLLEEIQRHVLRTVVGMNTVGLTKYKLTDDTFLEMLRHSHTEVEEIFVHVFDFMYFYGMSPAKYVRGIWASWGTIPNINARVHDYVIRTICAVLVGNLRRSVPDENIYPEDISKDQVMVQLRALADEEPVGAYVNSAIDYIERYWESEIRQAVQIRRQLVKVVHTFLYSEDVAHELQREIWIRSKSGDKDDYALTKGRIEESYIMNPLRFIETYTNARKPSSRDSAWIYYILAFCIDDDD